MSDPVESTGEVGKGTVELGFIGGVDQTTHGGSGGESESQQVPSQEKGMGSVLLDLKAGGGLEECEDSRGRDRGSGWATAGIGGHDDGEVLDGFGDQALGEATDGAIGGILAIGHVLGDQGEHALEKGQGQAESGEEGVYQLGAFLFVTWGNDA